MIFSSFLNWLFSIVLLSSPIHAIEQPDLNSINLTGLVVSYSFGESIDFDAQISPGKKLPEIDQILLSLQPVGTNSSFEEIDWNSSEQIHFSFDASGLVIQPFSDIQYQFLFILNDSTEIYSPIYSFNYADNRFDWHTIENSLFKISWNHNEMDIGTEVLDIAARSYPSAKRYLNTELSEKINIYVYSDKHDLQNALDLTNQNWVAGHAEPSKRIALVSASGSSPELLLELERQIPHEISHILIYDITGEKYNEIPSWLNEGIASASELYPSPNYSRVLSESAKKMELLPLESLCASFPSNSQDAYLAYAQSASFTRYLYKNFGSEKLNQLLLTYSKGMGCTQGIETVYDKTLAQLEYQWQQESLGINSEMLILRNLAPHLILAVFLIMIPILGGVVSPKKEPEESQEKTNE